MNNFNRRHVASPLTADDVNRIVTFTSYSYASIHNDMVY
jgi:hypothetical protein